MNTVMIYGDKILVIISGSYSTTLEQFPLFKFGVASMFDHFHLGRNDGVAEEFFEDGRNNTFP